MQSTQLTQSQVLEVIMFHVMKPNLQAFMEELNRIVIYINTIKSVEGLTINPDDLISQVKHCKIEMIAGTMQHFNRDSLPLLLCMIIVDQCRK